MDKDTLERVITEVEYIADTTSLKSYKTYCEIMADYLREAFQQPRGSNRVGII